MEIQYSHEFQLPLDFISSYPLCKHMKEITVTYYCEEDDGTQIRKKIKKRGGGGKRSNDRAHMVFGYLPKCEFRDLSKNLYLQKSYINFMD